jgi:predicted nucleic acid-binding protein
MKPAMSESIKKFYWDSSCFMCLLNEDEQDRRYICTDILRHAELGNIEIWTSTATICEVIRPKDKFIPLPLPDWCAPVLEKFPDVEQKIRELWDYFKRRTMPKRLLSGQEIAAIESLFSAPYIKAIHLDERTAKEAVRMAQQFGLMPMDAIHAASAFLKKPPIDKFHVFDKDYKKVAHLLNIEEPVRISPQEGFKEFVRPITE